MYEYPEEVKLLKALTHSARLAILEILRGGEECVCHLEIISNNSARGGDTATYLTGARVRFGSQNIDPALSGKGGVGKSLVTGLLATALKRAGYNIGILDADITGASIPKLFGIHGPLMATKDKIQPILSRTEIKIVSVNLALENESTAFVWRGAMITKAIQQFWNEVDWGGLDFLMINMPPGTSDAALTVMQELSVKEILMVTSPQSLAAMIVKKALDMAQKMNASIVGIIENMAGFTAPDTGKHYEIFGPSHAAEVTESTGAPLLARLPIDL